MSEIPVAPPSEFAYQLLDTLGKEKLSPLGPCTNLGKEGGCIRRHGVNDAHKSRYCESCWGYVLANCLYGMLRNA